MHPERSESQCLHYHLQSPPHPYMSCLSPPTPSTCAKNSKPPPPYTLSPPPPSSTQVQQGCLSTKPLPRSTSWRLTPCQTQYQFTMSMELQMRMDPSQRKSRSYSSMGNTWRKCALQSPTSDGRR